MRDSTSGAEAKRAFHKPSLMMAAGVPASLSRKVRPRAGATPRIGKRLGVTPETLTRSAKPSVSPAAVSVWRPRSQAATWSMARSRSR